MTSENARQNQKQDGLRITGQGELTTEELELAPKGKPKREPKIPPKVAAQRKAKGEAKGTPGKLCGAPGCMRPQAKGGGGKCEEHAGGGKEAAPKGKPAKKDREPKPKRQPKQKPLKVTGRYGGILTLPIDRLELDPVLQIRSRLDRDAIERYTELYRDGGARAMDEVCAMQIDDPAAPDGVRFKVTDGWHRIHAARAAGIAALQVDVNKGDDEKAVIEAARANNYHGVPLTTEDKRRAVRALLATREYAGKSDRKVAEALMVSHTFVANIRREIAEAATKGGGGAIPPAPAPEREPRKPAPPEPEPDEGDGEEESEAPKADAPATPPADPLEIKPATLDARMQDAKRVIGAEILRLTEIAAEVEAGERKGSHANETHWPLAFVNADAVRTDIANAIAGLRASAPAGLCPYCSGDGCGECRGQGWLGKLRMQHVPAELKPKGSAGGKKGGAA